MAPNLLSRGYDDHRHWSSQTGGRGRFTSAVKECDPGDGGATPQNLNGATCESQNFVGGELSCTNFCRFDVSQCSSCEDSIEKLGRNISHPALVGSVKEDYDALMAKWPGEDTCSFECRDHLGVPSIVIKSGSSWCAVKKGTIVHIIEYSEVLGKEQTVILALDGSRYPIVDFGTYFTLHEGMDNPVVHYGDLQNPPLGLSYDGTSASIKAYLAHPNNSAVLGGSTSRFPTVPSTGSQSKTRLFTGKSAWDSLTEKDT